MKYLKRYLTLILLLHSSMVFAENIIIDGIKVLK